MPVRMPPLQIASNHLRGHPPWKVVRSCLYPRSHTHLFFTPSIDLLVTVRYIKGMLRELFDHPNLPSWTPKIEIHYLYWAVGRVTTYTADRIRERPHYLKPLALALNSYLRKPEVYEQLGKYLLALPPTRKRLTSHPRWGCLELPGLGISLPKPGDSAAPAGRFTHAPLEPYTTSSSWAETTGLKGTLENPPSNWHIAQYIFNVKDPFGSPATPEGGAGDRWARVLYMWYMLGVPRRALENFAPLHGAEDFGEIERNALEQLMRVPRFQLWALGCDLRPAVIKPEHAQVLVFAPMRKRAKREALEHLISHPYVRTILRDKLCPNPVDHIIGPTWNTVVHRNIESYLDDQWKVHQADKAKARAMYLFGYLQDNEYAEGESVGTIPEKMLQMWGTKYK